MVQAVVDVETTALAGQVNPGDAFARRDVDEGLLHLDTPLAKLRGVERCAGQPLDFFQTGTNEVVTADGAVVGQFQGEGRLRSQRARGAPQSCIVDAKTEEAQLAFAHQPGVGQHLAPAG